MDTGNFNKRFQALTWMIPFLFVMLSGAELAAQDQVVPVVDGHLGRCSADFTVKDEDNKPLYDAKIDVTIRYGFLGLRRMSLQVGTNGEGRARVAGLPDKSDKKLYFQITSGTLSDTVLMNISDGCNARFEVTLKEEGSKSSDGHP